MPPFKPYFRHAGAALNFGGALTGFGDGASAAGFPDLLLVPGATSGSDDVAFGGGPAPFDPDAELVLGAGGGEELSGRPLEGALGAAAAALELAEEDAGFGQVFFDGPRKRVTFSRKSSASSIFSSMRLSWRTRFNHHPSSQLSFAQSACTLG